MQGLGERRRNILRRLKPHVSKALALTVVLTPRPKELLALPTRLMMTWVMGVLLFACLQESEKGIPASERVIIASPAFPDPLIPSSNPTTRSGVTLGRRLFHDPLLSGDSSQSCAQCHTPQHAFTEPGRRFSIGIHGDTGTLNAPTLTNIAWARSLFWDGRAETLEEQALEPVPNPIEMSLPWPEAVARLRNHEFYPDLFDAAFGSKKIDSVRVVRALAQFQRTLISANSKWDRVQRGEEEFTPTELQGEILFNNEKGDCFHCHAAPLFGDGGFRNNGLDERVSGTGRARVTGAPGDAGKWKTPTLRNIAATPPYMHDGRFATLEEVLDHYAEGIRVSSTVDDLMLLRLRRPPDSLLTPEDREDLIAFLRTLTDDVDFLQNPEFMAP
jgi:cytochrome c peroxidase